MNGTRTSPPQAMITLGQRPARLEQSMTPVAQVQLNFSIKIIKCWLKLIRTICEIWSSELICSIFSLSRLYPFHESLSLKIFLPKCSRWCRHHPIHLRPFLRLPYTTAATAPFPSSTPCRAHQRWCSLVRQWYQLLERCNPDLDQWAASCHLPFKCTIPSWFRLIR